MWTLRAVSVVAARQRFNNIIKNVEGNVNEEEDTRSPEPETRGTLIVSCEKIFGRQIHDLKIEPDELEVGIWFHELSSAIIYYFSKNTYFRFSVFHLSLIITHRSRL